MVGIQFDWTINVGNVIAITILLIGGAKFLLAFNKKIVLTDQAISGINKTLESFKDVLTTLATQQTTMQYLQKQIDEMKHGEGFVFPRFRPPEK